MTLLPPVSFQYRRAEWRRPLTFIKILDGLDEIATPFLAFQVFALSRFLVDFRFTIDFD